MRLLYTMGISLYAFGVRVAALFNGKAKLMVAGWGKTMGKLAMAPVGQGKTAWFHASSLGEFEQARPVIEAFRQQYPDYKVCLTFFSPSGYEVRKDYPLADFVCYLPMDTRDNARRFINLLHPTVAFSVKYDYWFNYLEQLRMRQIPTYIFSAIFRPDQYFFKDYGRWFLKHLQRCFTHIFVQNEESLHLLQQHGVMQCSIAGDTRFDRVNAVAHETEGNGAVEDFIRKNPGRKVIVAGSSWEPDEELLARYFEAHKEQMTLIVAPHVIAESHLSDIEQRLFAGHRTTRYSHLAEAAEESLILLIDNIGMLAQLYRYADVAYIGGGFGHGIHNILEAVTYGKPVVFGPKYRKFQEGCDMVAQGGGFSIGNYRQLAETLDRLMGDEEAYRQAAETCKAYIHHNLGSTELILDKVNGNPLI